MQCKVSVIIPVCNVGKYLRQCLDSVCGQTLTDIEIICVDDKSDDNSLAILREYRQKDQRLIILENEARSGAAESRNKGIKIARGDYLSILDGDDYFESNMLEIAYKCCKKTNADICGYDFWEFDNDSGDTIFRNNQPIYYIRSRRDQPPNENAWVIINAREVEDCFNILYNGGAWQKMYRREFIIDNGLFFQSLPNANDAYFCLMTSVLAQRITYIHKAFVHYRVNRSGQTISKISKYPLSLYQVYAFLYQQLVAHGRYDCVKSAYNSIAVNTVIAIMRQMSERDARQALYQKIQEDKLLSLGLREIEAEDFLYYHSYWMAKKMFEVESADALLAAIENHKEYWEDRKEYCFKELRELKLTCALWGYGELGKKWLDDAKRFHYDVHGIIDEDKTKQGVMVDHFPITAYKDCPADIDAVIITNSKYRQEILRRIRAGGRKQALIDFDYFMHKDKKVHEAIFR